MSILMDQPLDRFRTTRRVEFSDTDMGGIVHFSRFFVYMETAEHEFLRALGINVHFKHEGRTLGWPKRSVECEYLAPARLGEELEIEVRVVRKGKTSLSNEFVIRCGETLVARGRLSSVCCVLDDPGGVRAVPIPGFLADRIVEAPAFPGKEEGAKG
jgi:acyl-CoA thioester hydrolase